MRIGQDASLQEMFAKVLEIKRRKTAKVNIMNNNPIGLVVSDANPVAALQKVRSFGIPTCQLYAPSQVWHSEERISEIMEKIKATHVKITSIICTFEKEDYSSIQAIRRTVGLVNPKLREERVRWVLLCSDLARKLGVKVLQCHLGFIPERNDPKYRQLVTDVRRIAEYLAENGGQVFALETGQESASELLLLIRDVSRPNVKVNFDPANFLIYDTDEPLKALRVLKDCIVGVHCKDARRPRKKGELGEECLLGEGEVDIAAFVIKLRELGYMASLTIEREISGEEQIKDVLKAKELLESLK